MEQVPAYVAIVFIITTIMAVYLFFRASGNNYKLLMTILAWSAATAITAALGLFADFNSIPPPFLFVMAPPLGTMVLLMITPAGKKFLDSFDLRMLTILQSVRILIEVGLFLLFIHKAVPELMTFEGRNFDILTGLSAPIIYYAVFVKKTAGHRLLLTWNIIGLCLALFIVGNAMLAAPSPFQQFAFDQPNRAVFFFPYVWLPTIIVPICIIGHIGSIRQMMIIQRKVLPIEVQ